MAAKRIAALIRTEASQAAQLERLLSLEWLGVDELVLLAPDLGEGTAWTGIRRLARALRLPLAVGGAPLDLDGIALLLEAGADRVFLDLPRDGALLEPAAARFGRAVLGVRSAVPGLETLRECCERGAGEILLEPGPDPDSLLALAALPVPVMVRCADAASAELALQCGADAVALDPVPEGAHAVKALKASLAAQGLLLRD